MPGGCTFGKGDVQTQFYNKTIETTVRDNEDYAELLMTRMGDVYYSCIHKHRQAVVQRMKRIALLLHSLSLRLAVERFELPIFKRNHRLPQTIPALPYVPLAVALSALRVCHRRLPHT